MHLPLRALLAAAALAAAPAAHAQSKEIGQAGIWHIVAGSNDCTALTKDAESGVLIALIHPRPGKKTDAALMLTGDKLFGGAIDRQPYPLRLVLADDNDFDTRWQDVAPTGMVLNNGTHGIRIAAPAEAFADGLAKAEALRLEGDGPGFSTVTLKVQDMRAMVDALRKCVAPQ